VAARQMPAPQGDLGQLLLYAGSSGLSGFADLTETGGGEA